MVDPIEEQRRAAWAQRVAQVQSCGPEDVSISDVGAAPQP